MGSPVVQCVPNFSEGRDVSTIKAIVDALRSVKRVRLADWSADIDHNRMVVTFVGAPEPVSEAAFAAAKAAVERIDLRKHTGVHPRLGAIDVLPFVPIRDICLDECAHIAHNVGARIASELSVPVFFYEAAAPGLRSLPTVRKTAFAELRPDIGPAAPHISAGAVVCGARGPLIAFNVNLTTADLDTARLIAGEIRSAFDGRVRALGLLLESRRIAQVSMNIIRPQEVSLSHLVEFVESRAEVLESELIGVLPGYTAFETVRSSLRLTNLKPGQVLLENWAQDDPPPSRLA